jgi:hypothetical protein
MRHQNFYRPIAQHLICNLWLLNLLAWLVDLGLYYIYCIRIYVYATYPFCNNLKLAYILMGLSDDPTLTDRSIYQSSDYPTLLEKH